MVLCHLCVLLIPFSLPLLSFPSLFGSFSFWYWITVDFSVRERWRWFMSELMSGNKWSILKKIAFTSYSWLVFLSRRESRCFDQFPIPSKVFIWVIPLTEGEPPSNTFTVASVTHCGFLHQLRRVPTPACCDFVAPWLSWLVWSPYASRPG